MKADEEIVQARAKLESVEILLQDKRIVPELRQEIRQHFQASKLNTSVDMAALFRQRFVLHAVPIQKICLSHPQLSISGTQKLIFPLCTAAEFHTAYKSK